MYDNLIGVDSLCCKINTTLVFIHTYIHVMVYRQLWAELHQEAKLHVGNNVERLKWAVKKMFVFEYL